MKQICLNIILDVNDDAITARDLKDALSKLGRLQTTFESEVDVCDTSNHDDANCVWLYRSSDDDEPMLLVSSSGDTDGLKLTDAALEFVSLEGVCVEFVAEYPDGDKYGSPAYATDDSFAAGVVGNFGLAVAHHESFVVNVSDRGDDGSEQYWLKMSLSRPLDMFGVRVINGEFFSEDGFGIGFDSIAEASAEAAEFVTDATTENLSYVLSDLEVVDAYGNSQKPTNPASDNAPGRLIHGQWGHIFHAAAPETMVRFVFDVDANKVTDMEFQKDQRWHRATTDDMAVVTDSLINANEDALESPQAYGLESSFVKPVWAQ